MQTKIKKYKSERSILNEKKPSSLKSQILELRGQIQQQRLKNPSIWCKTTDWHFFCYKKDNRPTKTVKIDLHHKWLKTTTPRILRKIIDLE
jgi:hypothetical protein